MTHDLAPDPKKDKVLVREREANSSLDMSMLFEDFTSLVSTIANDDVEKRVNCQFSNIFYLPRHYHLNQRCM